MPHTAARLAVGAHTEVEHGSRWIRAAVGRGDLRVDELKWRDRVEGNLAVEVRLVLREGTPGERGGTPISCVRCEVARQKHRPPVAVGHRVAGESRVAELGPNAAA